MTKLDEPFPSSPRRPPIVGIYMTNPQLQSWHYIPFSARYSAAAFLDLAQEVQGNFKLENDDIYFDSGWVLSTRGISAITIKELLRYQPTKEESNWKIPNTIIQTYSILKTNDDTFKSKHTNSGTIDKPIRKVKEVDAQPMLTLAQLAQDLGISASKARKALRAQNIAKPYEWPENDCAHIIKLLKSAH